MMVDGASIGDKAIDRGYDLTVLLRLYQQLSCILDIEVMSGRSP
jgi:hypothetical protein